MQKAMKSKIESAILGYSSHNLELRREGGVHHRVLHELGLHDQDARSSRWLNPHL